MSSEDPQGAAGGVPSIISPDLKIVGELKSDGEIQIDGTVKGDIKAHMLTVGEQGKVDGSTVAETVRIFGTVNGRVQAKTVRLDKSARVDPAICPSAPSPMASCLTWIPKRPSHNSPSAVG